MHNEPSRIQQQGWKIEIESKNGSHAEKSCKRQRKNSLANKIQEGQIFSMLTAIAEKGRDKKQSLIWLFQCDCGNSLIATVSNVISNNTRSCGCLRIVGKTTHSACGTPEHKAWGSIKDRCFCKTNCNYKYYGARGITMFEEWRSSFQAFYHYIGPRPSPSHSIDRIDVNGNYEPGNVRWATDLDQANNRRNNKFIEFNGATLTCSQWSAKLGFKRHTIHNRLRDGWSIEKTLTTPLKQTICQHQSSLN
jgi:hypothetical protein